MSSKDGLYFVWKKGERHKLGKFFSSHEFDCKCNHSTCQEQRISVKLIETLDNVRTELGKPLIVTSGFRCAQHQNDLRARLNTNGQQLTVPAGRVSQHELGNAADITPSNGIMTGLDKIVNKFFDSIGIARSFFHVDTRPKKDDGSKRIWNY